LTPPLRLADEDIGAYEARAATELELDDESAGEHAFPWMTSGDIPANPSVLDTATSSNVASIDQP
jgi:hypothetical protein